MRIVLEVEEFVGVPEPVVGDVLETVAAQREDRRRLRKVFFPVVNVEKMVAPRRLDSLRERQETAAIDLLDCYRDLEKKTSIDRPYIGSRTLGLVRALAAPLLPDGGALRDLAYV